MGSTFLWRIEVRVPERARDVVGEVLERRSMAVSAFANGGLGEWRIEGLAGAEPDAEALAADLARAARELGIDRPTPRIELVPPKDWVAENLAEFPPLEIGRYFIHGSHHGGPVPAGAVAMKLDAGTAFGSGEHASTAGCLIAFDRLARSRRFGRVLDMGCGSGILGLAAAKTWKADVTACDVDAEAVRVARLNARRNGVGPRFRAIAANGYANPAIAANRPYDLIVSNILARPLIAMAGDLVRHLAPEGRNSGVAVLSGLLERDGNRVIAAHRAHRLKPLDRIVVDGWLTVVLER